MFSKRKALVALLVAFGVIAAACGSDDGDEVTTDETTDEGAESTSDEATDETTDEGGEAAVAGDMPGSGVSVTMAKADWTTEDPNAYVIHNLLEELGYDVSDPADLELGPSNAYIAMAQGDADFWINSWYPGHNQWLENALPDNSKVGDQLTVVGEMMMAGGLQGYLITKPFAEEYGITSLDDFEANAEAIAAYDAQDPDPGNGVADIYGCQESWTCDDIITSQIAFSGWENIQQTIAGYDAMFAEAATKADAGEPAIIYTWTPSAYITQLRPGDNVLWLEVNDILDDSNPTGVQGGEEHDQRPGIAGIGEDACPGSEGGQCQLGWVAADIQATANTEWLEANPAAAKLLELFTMDVVEVSLLNVEMDDGASVTDLAVRWIEENRDTVDGWLAEARAAA
jgi:glycine betaine/proline transport system substrate-binding protein